MESAACVPGDAPGSIHVKRLGANALRQHIFALGTTHLTPVVAMITGNVPAVCHVRIADIFIAKVPCTKAVFKIIKTPERYLTRICGSVNVFICIYILV